MGSGKHLLKYLPTGSNRIFIKPDKSIHLVYDPYYKHLGAFDYKTNQIILNPVIHETDKELVTTFIHELIHAIDAANPPPGKSKNFYLSETHVERISKGIADFLYLNKWLLK